MAERIVVALGGNALGKTPEQQLELVKGTAKPIVDLVEKGYEVIIGHGNGPQVGMINLAMEFSANKGGGTPFMPFPECGAMTQGYIGYHLQQAIQEELKARGIQKECATVVTQGVFNENDPGFQHPTKPVGSFYTTEEAEKIVRMEVCKAWEMPGNALDAWTAVTNLVQEQTLEDRPGLERKGGLIYYRVFLTRPDEELGQETFGRLDNMNFRVALDGTIMGSETDKGWRNPKEDRERWQK